MAKLRILLADDHAVVREGMKYLINTELDMEVIGEAGDGQAALEQTLLLKPDILVLDISMPELNGVQVAEQLLPLSPNCRVLALTIHEDRSYLRELLAAGVSGYVLKRAATSELILAIRTVAGGGTYLDPSMAGKIVNSLVRDDRGQEASPVELPPEPQLSERETEVIRLIARGYSNREIATQLILSVKRLKPIKPGPWKSSASIVAPKSCGTPCNKDGCNNNISQLKSPSYHGQQGCQGFS